MYHLFTLGHKSGDVFIGSFSTLENAQKRTEDLGLHRRIWIERDENDAPVLKHNIVWEKNIHKY